MDNLYIVRLHALRFVTCKLSVDAFSLLYSNFLLEKLSPFVFGATFAECIGNLLAHLAVYS